MKYFNIFLTGFILAEIVGLTVLLPKLEKSMMKRAKGFSLEDKKEYVCELSPKQKELDALELKYKE